MFIAMYLELHASSAFSFLEAASLPETLIAQAARYGYPAIALLDRDGVYGAPRFHRAATAAGIKAIIGAELTIAAASLALHRTLATLTRTLTPASARSRGIRRRLPEPLQAHHAHENARAERRGRADARRARRPDAAGSSRWRGATCWGFRNTASAD